MNEKTASPVAILQFALIQVAVERCVPTSLDVIAAAYPTAAWRIVIDSHLWRVMKNAMSTEERRVHLARNPRRFDGIPVIFSKTIPGTQETLGNTIVILPPEKVEELGLE